MRRMKERSMAQGARGVEEQFVCMAVEFNVERLDVWGSKGRRETPDGTWSPSMLGGGSGRGRAPNQAEAGPASLRVCDAQSRERRRRIDSTVAREVREVRMREDPVGTSARPVAADRGHTHTQTHTVLTLRCRLMAPVWSLLSICTTGHQASTGLLLGRRVSTRSMFGPLLTRTHRDAPELSTKMHAGGPCQKPPPT